MYTSTEGRERKETAMTRTSTETIRKHASAGFPFAAAFMPGNKEWETASNQLMETWKQQLDAALRLVDATVQRTLEMRSSQLAAAMETHARDVHAETSVSRAKSVMDLWAIQIDWMSGNFERSLAYWNQMLHAANDANSKILESLREHTQALSSAEDRAKNLPPS
jgi:hypothetical protein